MTSPTKYVKLPVWLTKPQKFLSDESFAHLHTRSIIKCIYGWLIWSVIEIISLQYKQEESYKKDNFALDEAL